MSLLRGYQGEFLLLSRSLITYYTDVPTLGAYCEGQTHRNYGASKPKQYLQPLQPPFKQQIAHGTHN